VTLYLDTSALVKLYVAERGSKQVKSALNEAEDVAIATVGYAEARAALARRQREGALTERGLRTAVRALERDWASFTRLEVTDGMARLAGGLAEHHSLRGFDAVHLAAALMLQREVGTLTFLGFDDRLTRAARSLLEVEEG
jgi:predicted nucleic acid-binding protein